MMKEKTRKKEEKLASSKAKTCAIIPREQPAKAEAYGRYNESVKNGFSALLKEKKEEEENFTHIGWGCICGYRSTKIIEISPVLSSRRKSVF